MATPSVLITGCSSGFGWATAQTLARRGYIVFATMRDVAGKNAEAAGALRGLARQENLALSVVEMDITDDASVQQAVNSLLATAGRIDVVVHNAGRGVVGLAEAMEMEALQALFEVNVLGALRVNRAVLPTMRQQQSGLLIYLSSSGSRLVYPFMGVYGATKAALEAIAETLHYEVYGLGIDTAIIQAGMYATDFGQKAAMSSDPALEAAYGLAGQIAQGFMGNYAATMAAGGNPQQVADFIADLIAMPAGQRPFRTVIGPFTEGLVALNPAIEAVQSQVLPSLGLDSLLARSTT
jgi:NAD(P)-dependent dehydrogenase (short-subunit alcohol dehydrogenase family)